jgi:serine/threonine protein kinase
MLDLNEFAFWQNQDLSEFDDRLVMLLLFQEFNLNNITKVGLLLEHFGYRKRIYPFYDAIEGYKYCYSFEVEHMKLAFEFYHDEMEAFKTLLTAADLTKETDTKEEHFLEIIRKKKQFEQKFELDYTIKMFGAEILDKLDEVKINDINFDDSYTVNGTLGKVKIGTDKNKQQITVKINPVWRKSDVDVLKSFLATHKDLPINGNLLQVHQIGLDIKKRSGKRYEYAYFYSMEQADNLCDLEGYCPKTLANILSGGNKLSPSEAVYLLKELAKGLKALHDAEKVHGKIHPENILWVDNVPKLSELTCGGNLNNPFTFKDTILPSEQKKALSVKASTYSDIYALVVCAYRAVTGNSEALFPEIPFEFLKTPEGRYLNKIFLKTGTKSKRNRYSSIEKLQKDLEQIDISEKSISFDKKYTHPKDEKEDIFINRLGERIMSKLDDVKLKDYKVVKNFRGAGGFGDVRIYEYDICQFRAIKRVNLNNPRAIQEAESVLLYKEKAPEHPNLIKIFEVGCDTEITDGVEEHFFFYTMEAGDNLFELCHPEYRYYHPVSLQPLKYKDKKYGLDETLDKNFVTFSGHILLKHVIEGLAALHEVGLVHRDIKPDNLILVGGVLTISDVGLVTTIDSIDSVAGTEGYLPPEYIEQSCVDIQRLQKDAVKNDLFAAGASTLNAFEIFPLPIRDVDALVDIYIKYYESQQLKEDDENYGYNKDIELYLKLIKKICAKHPEDRFNSASEILSEFPEDFIDSFKVPDEFDMIYSQEQADAQDAAYIDYESYRLANGRLP